jgi:hypothetical protein
MRTRAAYVGVFVLACGSSSPPGPATTNIHLDTSWAKQGLTTLPGACQAMVLGEFQQPLVLIADPVLGERLAVVDTDGSQVYWTLISDATASWGTILSLPNRDYLLGGIYDGTLVVRHLAQGPVLDTNWGESGGATALGPYGPLLAADLHGERGLDLVAVGPADGQAFAFFRLDQIGQLDHAFGNVGVMVPATDGIVHGLYAHGLAFEHQFLLSGGSYLPPHTDADAGPPDVAGRLFLAADGAITMSADQLPALDLAVNNNEFEVLTHDGIYQVNQTLVTQFDDFSYVDHFDAGFQGGTPNTFSIGENGATWVVGPGNGGTDVQLVGAFYIEQEATLEHLLGVSTPLHACGVAIDITTGNDAGFIAATDGMTTWVVRLLGTQPTPL